MTVISQGESQLDVANWTLSTERCRRAIFSVTINLIVMCRVFSFIFIGGVGGVTDGARAADRSHPQQNPLFWEDWP
jgi:hypothetical protein